MSQVYDNWERLVKATLLREELRRLCREDSLSSGFSSSFSSSESSGSDHEESLSPNPGILSSFSYRQITRATDRFRNQNLINQGHSGDFFLGSLFSDRVVVKRINIKVVSPKSLASELGFLSRVDSNNHPRFVQLLGHCLDGDESEKFLVYRYLPKRDLSNSLFFKEEDVNAVGNSLSSLDWITRLKIARGVAEALSFLHHDCTPPLVHGDVQASSILLDDNFEVRLGSLSHVSAERIHKDLFAFTWKSKKATSDIICAYDIYCFGKVLLELVTGKLGISSSTGEELKVILEKTLLYITLYDMALVTNIVDTSLIIDDDLLEEVWAMALIARACLNPQPTRRPIVRHVLLALENPTKVVREEDTVGGVRSKTKPREIDTNFSTNTIV